MTRKAVYAGSFDPPTNGHMFMIREGARLFDELVVAVGVNPDKKSTFTAEERVELLKQITAPFDNVVVDNGGNPSGPALTASGSCPGVQSLDARGLRQLGRVHEPAQALSPLAGARASVVMPEVEEYSPIVVGNE